MSKRSVGKSVAKIEVAGDDVVVTFGTVYRLLTWTRDMRIPLGQIDGVGPGAVEVNTRRDLQWPGIWARGTIMAGIFINAEGRTVWDVRDIERSVAIYISGGTYLAVVAGVDEPDATIATITRAVALFRSR
jgi:hypothetical protein